MSLQEIFQQARLNIPRYQRSYAWDEKQVNDLIDDVEYVLGRRNHVGQSRNIVHYFGTVVLDDIKEVSSPTPNDWVLYDIVDGQQRLTTISLLVGCICEELSDLEGHVNVDPQTENSPIELHQTYRNIYIKYRNKSNGRKFVPGDLTEDAYSQLVLSEKDPDVILSNGQKILPARKLAEAKETIQKRLARKRDAVFGGDIEDADESDLRVYFDYLYDVLSVIDNTFEVTRYRVDDTAEAGRLFEVVNDRGKDLTTAEKVKSHLLYCAGEIDTLDSEEVAREFNQAVETITISGGDEELVDQFVDRHWEMFTGETRRSRPRSDINGLHRRIKQIDRYAPLDRNPSDLTYWVNTYVQSLQDAAEAFYAVYNADHLQDQFSSIDKETVKRVRAISNSGAASTFRPLLMAAYLKLDVHSDEFREIVDACETFSFRAFEIMNRSTTLLRRSLKQEAHRLYVADQSQADLEKLFGEVPLDNLYKNIDDAVIGICDKIDYETGKRAPDEDVIEYLKRKDVIQGEFTTGWGGFHNKKTILYLLYEYERYLREQKGETGLETLVDFGTFVEEAQIEHIAPQNPGTDRAKLEDHQENRNRLGNLAFLWPKDNQDASNDEYNEKHKNIYSGSRIATLEALPSPKEGWDVEAINDREKKLIEFASERWSGRNQAHVLVKSKVSLHLGQELREQVQNHQKHANGKVPTIKFVPVDEVDVTSYAGATGKSCPNCGGNVTVVNEDGSCQCTCGDELDVPNYSMIRTE
ncbi:hypothetical protein C441_12475 [Haloferax sulfurifontis ATCC BAA-897]|uniref:DUF262 domain-containing protein n=2 Tax=Haloferax sulfurifontis TaxID=255616 RepID=M0I552_9EURY|nr:hypothetical protein C441_12475 [Haloferax sulfurifontis ATCC BAA-897]